jgi:predicted DNA-binding transcriptional regulator AlpA
MSEDKLITPKDVMKILGVTRPRVMQITFKELRLQERAKLIQKDRPPKFTVIKENNHYFYKEKEIIAFHEERTGPNPEGYIDANELYERLKSTRLDSYSREFGDYEWYSFLHRINKLAKERRFPSSVLLKNKPHWLKEEVDDAIKRNFTPKFEPKKLLHLEQELNILRQDLELLEKEIKENLTENHIVWDKIKTNMHILKRCVIEYSVGLKYEHHNNEYGFDFPIVFFKKIDHLELSIRTQNVLKYADIEYIGDIIKFCAGHHDNLLRLPNFGRKSLNELRETLDENGILTFNLPLGSWDKIEAGEKNILYRKYFVPNI